jgi:hypothetical protein
MGPAIRKTEWSAATASVPSIRNLLVISVLRNF